MKYILFIIIAIICTAYQIIFGVCWLVVKFIWEFKITNKTIQECKDVQKFIQLIFETIYPCSKPK